MIWSWSFGRKTFDFHNSLLLQFQHREVRKPLKLGKCWKQVLSLFVDNNLLRLYNNNLQQWGKYNECNSASNIAVINWIKLLCGLRLLIIQYSISMQCIINHSQLVIQHYSTAVLPSLLSKWMIKLCSSMRSWDFPSTIFIYCCSSTSENLVFMVTFTARKKG